MSLQWSDISPTFDTLPKVRFDLNDTNNEIRFDVRNYSVAVIQALKETTWATAVLTIERSIDGYNYVALETPATIPAGGGITGTIDTGAISWLRARLSTKEGSQVFANIRALGKVET